MKKNILLKSERNKLEVKEKLFVEFEQPSTFNQGLSVMDKANGRNLEWKKLQEMAAPTHQDGVRYKNAYQISLIAGPFRLQMLNVLKKRRTNWSWATEGMF